MDCAETLNIDKDDLGQSIQENLWKTAFKKFEGIWSA